MFNPFIALLVRLPVSVLRADCAAKKCIGLSLAPISTAAKHINWYNEASAIHRQLCSLLLGSFMNSDLHL